MPTCMILPQHADILLRMGSMRSCRRPEDGVIGGNGAQEVAIIASASRNVSPCCRRWWRLMDAVCGSAFPHLGWGIEEPLHTPEP